MRSRKIIAMVMTFLMMLSLLPSLVFASAVPSGELGGKLKIKGTAAVGSELSADYTKVTPEGLSDDYVSFSWSRKTGDQRLVRRKLISLQLMILEIRSS